MKKINILSDLSNKTYIVDDSLIKQGVDTYENDNLFTNCTMEQFEQYNDEEYTNFEEYLENNNIDFNHVYDGYFEEDEIREMAGSYKNVYCSFNKEIVTLEEYLLGFETIDYISYCNGRETIEKAIEIYDTKEIKLIETFSEGKEMLTDIVEYPYNYELSNWISFDIFQYDLYEIDGCNYLVYNSFYQGSLCYIECAISKEELKDRFNYELEE